VQLGVCCRALPRCLCMPRTAAGRVWSCGRRARRVWRGTQRKQHAHHPLHSLLTAEVLSHVLCVRNGVLACIVSRSAVLE
jgi:hypothetical protein